MEKTEAAVLPSREAQASCSSRPRLLSRGYPGRRRGCSQHSKEDHGNGPSRRQASRSSDAYWSWWWSCRLSRRPSSFCIWLVIQEGVTNDGDKVRGLLALVSFFPALSFDYALPCPPLTRNSRKAFDKSV